MLRSLRIKNIALLKSQDILFKKGFTVITGETGSGKSILLDSIDLLLGGQLTAGTRLFVPNKEMCSIEAIFSLTEPLKKLLKNLSIDYENNEVLITREWRFNEGRATSRSRINGIFINKNQSLQIRNSLIDFTFQGYSYKLNSPSQQLDCLDAAGHTLLGKVKSQVSLSWNNWVRLRDELKIINNKFDLIKIKHQEMEECLDELNKADLTEDNEITKLKIEQDRLVNSVTLKSSIEKILFILKEGTDQIPSLYDQLSLCSHDLKNLLQYDNTVETHNEECLNLLDNFNRFTVSLESYYSTLDADPGRLEEVQIRLNFLRSLEKKYNMDLSQLIHKRDQILEELYNIDIKNTVDQCSKKEELARLERDKNNSLLSDLRKKIAQEFETNLMKALRPLGLLNVRFKIQIDANEPNQSGSDSVRFLFSANPGEKMLPIEQIASGGEMSRFILALKATLAYRETSKIFIFDEIDSGVSGKVCEAIGKLLKDLSKNGQVLCVTHQPIVAAAADHHLCVTKSVNGGITSSNVKDLNNLSDRQKELAELAGGEIHDASLYAASLLEQQVA
ncbi:DNA repair protein RecN [Prochlorococcus sp. MIT 1223]|uniref:DNA repair protein RecN n=1 Tax=Prochlorococcus sp. MIT 1223 TaxID=3096217 RepID=UPI002A756246|nr:AAA family ATPase [Prochlorococcus sp. MIT 1223]